MLEILAPQNVQNLEPLLATNGVQVGFFFFSNILILLPHKQQNRSILVYCLQRQNTNVCNPFTISGTHSKFMFLPSFRHLFSPLKTLSQFKDAKEKKNKCWGCLIPKSFFIPKMKETFKFDLNDRFNMQHFSLRCGCLCSGHHWVMRLEQQLGRV